MNLALLGAAGVLLFATHYVADYWLQTDYQAQRKSKGGPLWGWMNDGLLTHILVYSLSFVPALLLLGLSGWKLLLAVVAIAIPHGWMDRRRFVNWFCQTTKGWRADNKVDWPVTVERVAEAFHAVEAHVVDFIWERDAIKPAIPGRASLAPVCYVRSQGSVYSLHPEYGWVTLNSDLLPTVRDLTPIEAAVRVHVVISMDQAFHLLSLALLAVWLAL